MIVSHRSFEFLPVSDKYFNRFVEKQVAELDAEISTVNDSKGDNRRMVKELEKAKKRLIVRLKKRADRDSKDRTMTFEELGVDQLFVDEADLYKNLAYVTKMTRIAGLPNSDSNRAFDMFLKIRYLQESVVTAAGSSSPPVHPSPILWPRCTRCSAISDRKCSPNGRSIISMRGLQTLPSR